MKAVSLSMIIKGSMDFLADRIHFGKATLNPLLTGPLSWNVYSNELFIGLGLSKAAVGTNLAKQQADAFSFSQYRGKCYIFSFLKKYNLNIKYYK